MKVLVIGSGGREHAIVKACIASPIISSVIAAPGNGGMQAEVPCHPLGVEDATATLTLAQNENVDFVIVGPEAPLAIGVVDVLEDAGFTVYGPRKAGAQLEASKTFTKDFLLKYNVPTAAGAKFTSLEKAEAYLETQSFPTVIKASGLAAGKGVLIPDTLEKAKAIAKDMLEGNAFGESGHEILIEEFMDGEEASIMLMVSGEKYVQLPPSQDHKRVGEGDVGLNTGGMGAYAPASVVTPEVNEKLVKEIIEPTLSGLKSDGIDFRGTLYIGIMIVGNQPKVVEFNVRFGDPECQILLPLINDDPIKLMVDCAKGTLEPTSVTVKDEFAAIIVQAAGGYPNAYRKGDVIQFPTNIPTNTSIIHAGTKMDANKDIVTSGGRVLGLVAHNKTLKAALKDAYALCDQVTFEDVYFRRDIGHRQLKRDA